MKKLLTMLLLSVFLLSACSAGNPLGVDSSGLEPFVIGGIAPLTEDFSAYGISAKNGAQLAVSEINATGGVNGFRLVLNFQDSKADGERALTVYEKLKNNEMSVLLGGIFSRETEALAAAASRDGLLMLTPSSGKKSALGDGGTVFRLCTDNLRLGSTAANTVADRNPGASVGVFYLEGDEESEELAQTFEDACALRELSATPIPLPPQPAPVTKEKLSTDTNLSTDEGEETVSPLPDLGEYDLIFLALSPKETRTFLQLYPEITTPLMICSVPDKTDLPDGTVVISSYLPGDTSVLAQNFAQAYKEAFRTEPDRYAADAYDSVYALAEAIRRAGITPSNLGERDTKGKLIDAMTRIDVQGIAGAIAWTTDGETTRPPVVKIYREGTYRTFEEEENRENP